MQHLDDNASLSYKHLKTTLSQKGVSCTDSKRIINGVQFSISNNEDPFPIRIFNTLTGIQIDVDDVTDTTLISELEQALRSLPSQAPNPESNSEDEDPNQEQKIIGLSQWGDQNFFGPLIVSGAIISQDHYETLKLMKIEQCSLSTTKRVNVISAYIKQYCPHSLVVMGDQSYNEFYAKVQNTSVITSWAQARVIENITRQSATHGILAKPFGSAQLMTIQLRSKGRNLQFVQDPKAEDHIGVHAAHVLALEMAIERHHTMKKTFGMTFPTGHSKRILPYAKRYIKAHGKKNLEKVAKLHFDVVEGLINERFKPITKKSLRSEPKTPS